MTKRILIATPVGADTLHVGFCASLLHMMLYSQTVQNEIEYECGFQFYGGSILPYSRQILATFALEAKYTHILYIDSDMTFPHWMLHRFVGYDKPIIGINAMARREPYRNTAQEAPGVEIQTFQHSTGLQQVRRTGFGVMYIDLDVFRKMSFPWFSIEPIPEHQVFKGDDFFFCDKVHDMGYEIWIDHDISKGVTHIGSFGYTPLMRASVIEMDRLLAEKRMNGGKLPNAQP